MKRNTRWNISRWLLGFSAVGACWLLSACGSSNSHADDGPPTPGGATVTLYVAGASPDAAPTILGTTVSDSNGRSQFTYTCPSPDALVYAVTSGGNGIQDAANPSIELMAALGPCSSAPSSFVINEVTTIAAVYALNAFRTIPGSDANPLGDMTQLRGKSPAIANAFATAALLADATTGQPAAFLPSATVCLGLEFSTPVVNCSGWGRLTALSNALGACVRSAAGSAPCTRLFTDTNASNTLQAALYIARNPGLVNIQDIYDLSTMSTLFITNLTAAPTDWTISLNFTNGFPGAPEAIAIDASGNVWSTAVGQTDSSLVPAKSYLVGLSPTGTPMTHSPYAVSLPIPGPDGPILSLAFDNNGNVWIANYQLGVVTVFDSSALPSGGFLPVGDYSYSAAGEANPTGIAIDGSGNAWLVNGNWTMTALSSSGMPLTGSPYTGIGLDAPTSIAIDANNHVWVANASASVTALDSSGMQLPGSPYTGGGLAGVGGQNIGQGIAIDDSGNIWVINKNNSVTALSSSGTPLTGSPYTGGGLKGAAAIAIDGDGNAWVASNGPETYSNEGGLPGPSGFGNSRITELSSSGRALSPSSGFTAGFMNVPTGIAIDGAGDVWVINDSFNSGPTTALSGANNGVTEFIGAAAPTLTPLAAQIFNHVQRTPPPPPPLTTYSIGGSLTGLASGASLVLQDNGGDNLPVSANGSFSFATAIASGAAYAVTVLTQPTGQSCVVSAGSGIVGAADITSVVVSCTTNTAATYTVGGTVSGLPGGSTLTLADNGGDVLQVRANGSFTFGTPIVIGATYDVTATVSPTTVTCIVSNGSGTIGSANVTNVVVTCQ
ncbi:MAG: two-component regulator propeller domain-containing protein [Steroidobacteraceae bacterium]|jgi:two component regulator with propeller domain